MVLWKQCFAYLAQVKILLSKGFNFAYWQIFLKLTFVTQLSHFYREKVLESPGHNILELYALVQVQLATSNLDIVYTKLSIRAASRVATQLKSLDLRKLTIITKMSNFSGAQCPVSLLEIKNLAITVKKYAKADIKVFQSCTILLDIFTLFHIFFGTVIQQTYVYWLGPRKNKKIKK